jgi:hypothetical protein
MKTGNLRLLTQSGDYRAPLPLEGFCIAKDEALALRNQGEEAEKSLRSFFIEEV